MHRVLRPGGGFALLWNDWDDDDPLMHGLNQIVAAPSGRGGIRGPGGLEGGARSVTALP